MNAAIKNIFSSIGSFLVVTKNRRLLYLIVISLLAFGDFFSNELARRTFLFYVYRGEDLVAENRMIYRSGVRETDIRRYVEEVLLGPKTPDLLPLFPRETRLNSLMYREGIVYADLSKSAALPLPEGSNVFRSLLTLREGVKRNFPFVKDVRLFIGGNEAFFQEFRGIFANSADNIEITP